MMFIFKRSHRHCLALLTALVGIAHATGPAASAERRPVPALTIYPGDIIRDAMLTEATFPDATATSVFISSRELLVGKVAKRTLLPGAPIPTTAVGVPRLISIGAMVRLVYEEGGLQIATYASALQNGAACDIVSVRNLESGITLSGVVQPDGSIRVGPG